MKCFVIRPFSETKHIIEGKEILISSKEWDNIYDKWIKRAIDNYKKTTIECICSKLVPGNFVKDIIKDLKESEIVIADLTGQRPNVFYELGIRHSLCLGTIIVSQDKNELPSDLKSYYCFEYKYTDKKHEYEELYKIFETDLHSKIDYILDNPDKSDNPVSDYLDIKHYYSKKVYEKERLEFSNNYNFLKNLINNYYTILENEQKSKEDRMKKVNFPSSFYNIYVMHSLWAMQMSKEYETINDDIYNEAMRIFYGLYTEFEQMYQTWESYSKNINSQNIERFYDLIGSALARKDGNIELIDNVLKQLNEASPVT